MFKFLYQRTLASEIRCSSVGVHSGRKVNMTIKPAPANFGIKFQRTDLPGTEPIPALFSKVVDTSLATVIGLEGVIVSTIEHLMAAFAGLSIDNALVELDNYEMPIMDGSAAEFTRLIKKAGITELENPRCFFVVNSPIEISDGDKYVGVFPSDSCRITCSIEFNHPLIRKQSIDFDFSDETFEKEVSKARTFGFFHEVEMMKRFGLGRGGSLENAIVIDDDKVLNEDGLRYPDEFVRHKLLDAIGDFSLIGMPILGHLKSFKSGHAFNHAFITKFFEEKGSWETKTLVDMKKQH